jgi:uncharacterized protein YndB with AHSA1/START domain/DNA-binding transcriptional ArsR family regulator
VDPSILSALGEPNRLRIVELLDEAPRSVGEIAATLGLRQPQTTKHLQTLERAGLVTMHPLGQRRIYALRREPLRDLRRWLEPFGASHPSETVLEQYARAIETERALALSHPGWATGRTLTFARELPAPAAVVWAHWTSPDLMRRWWSPEHFELVDSELHPVAGGRLEIVMQEGDGTRHVARGHVLALTPPEHLRFELGPVAPDGATLLSAVHDLHLERHGNGTKLSLAIRIIDASPVAAPAIAGMQPGWEQLLDKLQRALDLRTGG